MCACMHQKKRIKDVTPGKKRIKDVTKQFIEASVVFG